MTATTATVASARSRERAATLHAARWLLRRHLAMAGWATAILAVAVVVAVVLVDRYGSVDISIVQFGRQGFTWFPFSIAVLTATTYHHAHVAAGMTRRSLGRASLIMAVVTAAVYTAVMTLALQVERAVYGVRGWAQQITDALPLFTDTSQVGWIVLDLGLLFTAGHLCGLLVGIVYYRIGGWWGTLALPLTVGPVLTVNPLLTHSLLDPLGITARVAIAVVLLVVVAAVYLRLVHRVQIGQVST